jgi:hydroxyacyl-ACP dehydratase HTD2-like protein with hotdog domain
MFSVCSEIPVLSKGHPARNSLFVKAIRDVHSVFQEACLKKKKMLPYTVTSECVCTVLKISESMVRVKSISNLQFTREDYSQHILL